MAQIESINSNGLSPMPIRSPVVMGILSSPAFSKTLILALGFLLGANSCGMSSSESLSLEFSSIRPRLTFVLFSSAISVFVRFPALV